MPTSPSPRLGLIGPADTDPVAINRTQQRAVITQMEAKVAENPSVGAFTPVTGTPTYPTLPTSPHDGQPYLLKIAAAGSGSSAYRVPALWRFRYSTATATWDFEGGTPWFNQDTGDDTNQTPSAWTSGFSISHVVLPFGGTYLVEWGALRISPTVAAGGGPGRMDVGVSVNNAAPIAAFQAALETYGASGDPAYTSYAGARVSTFAQGSRLAFMSRAYQSDSLIGGRFIKVTPIGL